MRSFWLLWWLSLATWGQPARSFLLTLHSQPSEALIVDQFYRELGVTGKPFHFDPSLYVDQVHLTLLKKGFHPQSLPTDREQLRLGKFEHQVIVLRPLNSWVALQYWLADH